MKTVLPLASLASGVLALPVIAFVNTVVGICLLSLSVFLIYKSDSGV